MFQDMRWYNNKLKKIKILFLQTLFFIDSIWVSNIIGHIFKIYGYFKWSKIITAMHNIIGAQYYIRYYYL